jgi:type III restriction enzyme
MTAPRRPRNYLVLETKGFDDLAQVKAAAAERWVAAVNADGQHGTWRVARARKVSAVRDVLDAV